MNEKIKSCPFCGGRADVGYAINDYNRWGVCCSNCGCTVEVETWKGMEDTKENAIKAWNRRKIERLKLQKETKQMDKREYDQLIKTAADLECEAEVECKKEIEKRQKYKEGYMKGIEDFLDSIEGKVKE